MFGTGERGKVAGLLDTLVRHSFGPTPQNPSPAAMSAASRYDGFRVLAEALDQDLRRASARQLAPTTSDPEDLRVSSSPVNAQQRPNRVCSQASGEALGGSRRAELPSPQHRNGAFYLTGIQRRQRRSGPVKRTVVRHVLQGAFRRAADAPGR